MWLESSTAQKLGYQRESLKSEHAKRQKEEAVNQVKLSLKLPQHHVSPGQSGHTRMAAMIQFQSLLRLRHAMGLLVLFIELSPLSLLQIRQRFLFL